MTASGARADPPEAELIRRALDPQQKFETRSEACRALQLSGGAPAAEAMGTLLLDPQMHFMARYALAGISDPAASRVLQAALPRATEPAFAIGLLHSLGGRRDASAVPVIAGKLADRDPEVRGAALRALGQVGTAEALRVLAQWDATDRDRSTWEDAMVLASSSCAAVDAPAAVSAFRRLVRSGRPSTRGAAVVGLGRLGVLTIDEWSAALRSPERPLREAALALAATGTRDAFIPTAADMGEIPAEIQQQLVVVLAARGAPGARPAIRSALQTGEPRVRAAAARALGEMGDVDSADALFGIAFSDDGPGAGARAGLARLPGRTIDERLMQRFSRSDGQERAWTIEVLTARGHAPLVGRLLDPTLLESPVLLRATTEALRTLARVEEFGEVLAFTLRIPSRHRGELAAVLGHIARRADDAGKVLDHCNAALRSAEPATVAALLPLYAVVQGPEAVSALSVWIRHDAPAVRAVAVQTLGRWESGGSAALLLETAETHTDSELRRAAIRSLVGILRRRNVVREQEQPVELIRRALQASDWMEDRKALLAALPGYKGAAAKKLAGSFLEDPNLQAEAKSALERMK